MENQSKSCFAILGFCATVATIAAFALAMLVASATLAIALADRLESPGSENDLTVFEAEASLPAVTPESQARTHVSSIAAAKTHHPRRVR